MSFEEFQKNNKEFKKFSESLYSFSKKDIKQDDISVPKKEVQQNSTNTKSLFKDGEFKDDYEDFTEFEDENGTVLLVRYSRTIYEFRNNLYCKYILVNEKIGNREEGIAQIKNGQNIHIKDEDRLKRIREFMLHQKQETMRYFLEDKMSFDYYDGDEFEKTYHNLIAIGYRENPVFHDGFEIAYLIDTDERKNDIKILWQRIPYSSYYKRILADEFQEDIKKGDAYGTRFGGYIEDDSKFIEDAINSPNFVKIKNLKITHKEKQPEVKKRKLIIPKTVKILLTIPILIALIYPITEIILWIFAHVISIFASNITTEGVTNFATKYLPYAWHPDIHWFKHFGITISSLIAFGFLAAEAKEIFDLKVTVAGSLLALGFIYIWFVPSIFNGFATFSAWIVVFLILALFKG